MICFVSWDIFIAILLYSRVKVSEIKYKNILTFVDRKQSTETAELLYESLEIGECGESEAHETFGLVFIIQT